MADEPKGNVPAPGEEPSVDSPDDANADVDVPAEDGDEPKAPTYLLAGKWTAGMWFAASVAVVLVLVYAAALFVLAVLVFTEKPEAKEWDRVIYLLTGLETIALAAVAFLFGREVVRGHAAVATEAVANAETKVARSSGLAARSKIEEAQAKERAQRLEADRDRLKRDKSKIITEIKASGDRAVATESDVVDRLLARHIDQPVLSRLRADLAHADFPSRLDEDGRVIVISDSRQDELARLRAIADALDDNEEALAEFDHRRSST